MFQGLLPSEELLSRRHVLTMLPQCGACGLHKTCKSPKMHVDGKGKAKILILGEAPGREEDVQGRPFVGVSGDYLKQVTRKLGLDLREDCWLFNALSCRPENNKIKNKKSIEFCRPFVIKAIQELQPELIIPLGKVAVSSLSGWIWKEDPGPISRWVGWQIPCQQLNAWICPNYHPAHVLRADEKTGEKLLLEKFFYHYFRKALDCPGRPWKSLPNYESKIQRIYDAESAQKEVQSFFTSSPVAFDFETDRLKPDHPDAKILCCSLSDGKRTISFPWYGKVVEAMKSWLTSPTPKVGANSKFESRWCLAKLGAEPKNWVWDTVVNAHILDGRRGITGVKFQSFALLGADSYEEGLKAYMQAETSNTENTLRHVNLDKLLLYCGKDALFELQIAKIQARQLGRSL